MKKKVLFKAHPEIGVILYFYIIIIVVIGMFLYTTINECIILNKCNINIWIILLIFLLMLLPLGISFPLRYTIFDDYIEIKTLFIKWKKPFKKIDYITTGNEVDYFLIPSGKFILSFKNTIVIKKGKDYTVIAPRDRDYKKFLEIAQKQLEKVKCGEVQDE